MNNCKGCNTPINVTKKPGRPRKWCKACADRNDSKGRRDYHLRVTYGVDQGWYDSKLEEQGGSCYICKRPHQDSRYGQLYIDHDHETGKARGLLCQDCNHGLGKFFDNTEYLERAIMYLREHSE